jgi:hypothetical protein
LMNIGLFSSSAEPFEGSSPVASPQIAAVMPAALDEESRRRARKTL